MTGLPQPFTGLFTGCAGRVDKPEPQPERCCSGKGRPAERHDGVRWVVVYSPCAECGACGDEVAL